MFNSFKRWDCRARLVGIPLGKRKKKAKLHYLMLGVEVRATVLTCWKHNSEQSHLQYSLLLMGGGTTCLKTAPLVNGNVNQNRAIAFFSISCDKSGAAAPTIKTAPMIKSACETSLSKTWN